MLIVGCAAPVTFQSDPPRLAKGYVHDVLDKLIGKKKEEVLDELGDPVQVLSDQTTSYYIYSALGDDHKILFITWWPTWYIKTKHHYCLSLEFNNEDILQKYIYLRKNVADNVDEKYSCEFISIEDAKSATVDELLQEAKRGVSTAQYQIYKHTNHPDRLQWLCKSGEQGYWRAQWVLGYLHYYGSDGVHKSDILGPVHVKVSKMPLYGTNERAVQNH
ncbi:MAG: hypothetical protein ABW066_12725 [Sedimenticola sp.]